jgi:hypothetical protein
MMMAFSVVPPGIGKRTAAGTGFDADIAKLFNNVGGDYDNGDLNARYGDRFYPTPGGGPVHKAALMKDARQWHKLGLYSSFYSPKAPDNWAVFKCPAK